MPDNELLLSDIDTEMRGVHAISHIPPNTICMMIPRKCLITVEMGQATPIGQKIASSDLDLDAPKHIYLMIYVLWDRKINGINSFFYPYYDILPKTLNNMPIFWNDNELSLLNGSYLLNQIADRNHAIEDDYYSICQIDSSLKQICTLDEFKWARMCVCSRNFGLQIDGHRTSALVPHADMLNHYRPRETKWTFDEDKQAFTITTLQYVTAGSEVFDSYGQKCNHRFLLNYGFAIEDNRELDGFCPNEAPIELYVNENDILYHIKMDFWTRGEVGNNQTSSSYGTTIHHDGIVIPTPPAATTSTTNTTITNPTNNTNNSMASTTSRNFHNHLHSPQHHHPQHHQQHHWQTANNTTTPVIKRIRLCVANNENTRLLFSMLRTLACNDEELHAIASPASFIDSTTSNTAFEQQQLFPTDYTNTRTLYSLSSPEGRQQQFPVQQQQQQYFHHNVYRAPNQHLQYGGGGGVTSSTSSNNSNTTSTSNNMLLGGSGGFHRTCRDIRHPICLLNEREAMRLLLQIVNRHLRAYPTTLQKDCADLQDLIAFPRFSNQRHAKIQVRGEKEVLHHYASWARTALDVLNVLEEDLNQERGISDNVEVRLMSGGRIMAVESSIITSVSSSGIVYNNNAIGATPNFDYVIRQLEEDDNVHHTIVRYCSDVLGSLRREEMKAIQRQQRALLHQQRNHHQQLQQQHEPQQQQLLSNGHDKQSSSNHSNSMSNLRSGNNSNNNSNNNLDMHHGYA